MKVTQNNTTHRFTFSMSVNEAYRVLALLKSIDKKQFAKWCDKNGHVASANKWDTRNAIVDSLEKSFKWNPKKHTTIKRTKVVYNYVWRRSYRKVAEGGIGVATAKSVLKHHKSIRVRSFSSCYVGETALEIKAVTYSDMRDALSILKDYGYIDSIVEATKDIVAMLRAK